MAPEYLRKNRKIRKVYIAGLLLTTSIFCWGCNDDIGAAQSNAVQIDDTQDRNELEKEAEEESYFAEEGTDTSKTESAVPDEKVSSEPEEAQETEEKGDAALDERQEEEKERHKVKGIFVTGPMAGTSHMENLIRMVEETELNTMVIDIKNDEGRVTYDMQVPAVQEIGSDIRYIQDMEALVAKCKEKDIYLIARIVAFKDPFLADVKPEWCIHNSDGSIFRDKGGLAWLNPYNQEVWEYLLVIAKEALHMGFDEIQFDYIRFSTDSGMDGACFGEEEGEKDRQEIITDFAAYAAKEVHEAGGIISADVYGMVIDSQVDQRIVGQNYVELSRHLDYISPMVYPSHYGPYNYNIKVPDAEPYQLVLTALQSSRKVLSGIAVTTVSGNMEKEYTSEEIAALMPMEGVRAQVRPWLQDFTATWVKGHIPYGAEEIRAQIQAVYDAGYEEWILWNASNRYTEDGLLRADESE